VILFSPGVQDPIMRVSARGGRAERATEPGTGGTGSGSSVASVPARRQTVSLLIDTRGPGDERHLHRVAREDAIRTSGQRHRCGRFAPPDKLLSTSQGALQVYSFNPDTGAVSGEPVVIAQGFAGGVGAMAASATGVLAYRSGSAQRRQLVWVDRKGSVLRAIGEPEIGNTGSPELSADEQSAVVFSRSQRRQRHLDHRARTGLVSPRYDGPPADAHPLWDPDGQHVVYNSGRFKNGGRDTTVNHRRTSGAAVRDRSERSRAVVDAGSPLRAAAARE
jgi:hypothetical protein